MKTYKYLVVYIAKEKKYNGVTVGRVFQELKSLIEDIDTIECMEQYIKDRNDNFEQVTILNFKLLKVAEVANE